MKILLASSNEHKRKELEVLMSPHQLVLPKDLGICFDCDETGNTFLENATQKAMVLYEAVKASGIKDPGFCILADDSGLIVDALPGKLGIHSARYGSLPGAPILSAHEKNVLLLSELEGIPEERRTARFVCTLVLVTPDGRTLHTEGISEGRILEKEMGFGGFGYDPVFYNNEAGGNFGLLGTEAKNLYGHRGKAVRQMLEIIEKEF